MTVSETTHHSSSEAVRNLAAKTDPHKVAKKGEATTTSFIYMTIQVHTKTRLLITSKNSQHVVIYLAEIWKKAHFND